MNRTLQYLKSISKTEKEWFLEQPRYPAKEWKSVIHEVLMDFIENDLRAASRAEIEAVLRTR
jgi:hypothetical protein